MNNTSIRDLVDSYLLGQIDAANKEKLLTLIEADPGIAQYVRESEEAFAILQMARQRHLRHKLQAWDRESASRICSGKNPLLWFISCIGALVLFWFWLSIHYSPVYLATGSFSHILLLTSSSGQPEPPEKIWADGTNAFLQHDFEKAMLSFQYYLNSPDSRIQDHAQWNVFLCRLALENESTRWEEDVREYIRRAPEPFQTEARRLLRRLHTAGYLFVHHRWIPGALSSVKPKII